MSKSNLDQPTTASDFTQAEYNKNHLDGILTGIIIVLLIIVTFKWYKKNVLNHINKREASCKDRVCTVRTTLNYNQRCRIGCKGGNSCLCGNPSLQCDCPMSCACNAKYIESLENNNKQSNNSNNVINKNSGYAGDTSYNRISQDVVGPNPDHVTSMGPIPAPAAYQNLSDWQGSMTKGMALEDGVSESHARYCDSLSFAGMPTGASACITLEETGRSEGSANFVGLTARKFCKARQLAAPGCDARQTPSHMPTEWCNIDMDGLV